jgi:hypothetical protein
MNTTAWERGVRFLLRLAATPFTDETINIDEHGMRRTYSDRTVTPVDAIAFLGGSTVWGTGVDDDRTIPSDFVKWNPEYAGYNYGGSFVPILQPVIYFSETRVDHLKISESLKWQYEAVYPLIIELMQREFPQLAHYFMDLRTVFDRDDYCYTDRSHRSPNRNQLVAERISQELATRTGKAMASLWASGAR